MDTTSLMYILSQQFIVLHLSRLRVLLFGCAHLHWHRHVPATSFSTHPILWQWVDPESKNKTHLNCFLKLLQGVLFKYQQEEDSKSCMRAFGPNLRFLETVRLFEVLKLFEIRWRKMLEVRIFFSLIWQAILPRFLKAHCKRSDKVEFLNENLRNVFPSSICWALFSQAIFITL